MPSDRTWTRFTTRISGRSLRWIGKLNVPLYRATRGRLMGKVNRSPVLLLTTTGRKSGQKRTAPVLFGRDGDRVVVIGSNAGNVRAPAWALNLLANPQAGIQIRGEGRPGGAPGPRGGAAGARPGRGRRGARAAVARDERAVRGLRRLRPADRPRHTSVRLGESLEVAAADQPLLHLGPRELVERQSVAFGRAELAARPVRDAEHRRTLPTAGLEIGHRRLEVIDPVDEYRPFAAQMPGEQDRRRFRGEAQHGHARAEGLDRKDQFGAEDLDEMLDLRGDVLAGEVEKVQRRERHAPSMDARRDIGEASRPWTQRSRNRQNAPRASSCRDTGP